MSLNKSIQYGKAKRRPYRGAKAVDASCRNHGSCPHCQNGRKHKRRVMELSAREKISLFRGEVDEH